MRTHKQALTSVFTRFLTEVLNLVTGQRTDPTNGTAKPQPHVHNLEDGPDLIPYTEGNAR